MSNIHIYLLIITQIIVIDVILSGDNAVVIAMVANGVKPNLRNKAIFLGMVFALLLRILFTGLAGFLFNYKAIGLIGGLSLFVIDYKLLMDTTSNGNGDDEYKPKESFLTALIAIGIADLSMSIDNILAIAVVAHDNLWLMGLGLTLSIGIMGFGAKIVSILMEKWKWLNYVGILLILYIAVKMIIINFDVIPLDNLIKKMQILLS